MPLTLYCLICLRSSSILFPPLISLILPFPCVCPTERPSAKLRFPGDLPPLSSAHQPLEEGAELIDGLVLSLPDILRDAAVDVTGEQALIEAV